MHAHTHQPNSKTSEKMTVALTNQTNKDQSQIDSNSKETGKTLRDFLCDLLYKSTGLRIPSLENTTIMVFPKEPGN